MFSLSWRIAKTLSRSRYLLCSAFHFQWFQWGHPSLLRAVKWVLFPSVYQRGWEGKVPWLPPHRSATVEREPAKGFGCPDYWWRREPGMLPALTTPCSTGGFCRKPPIWGNDSNYVRTQPSPGRSSIYQMSSLWYFACWKDFIQGEKSCLPGECQALPLLVRWPGRWGL